MSNESGRMSPRAIFIRARLDPALRREGDMMGFTVCIAMLAALTAGRDHSPHSRLDVLAIVWGTTLGLALTHWFALTLSVRLVRDPSFRYSPEDMLLVQIAMSVLIAIAASAAVLLLSVEFDRLGARVTAAIFLAGLVGIESRTGGSSMQRAITLGVGSLTIAMAIATVKWFAG